MILNAPHMAIYSGKVWRSSQLLRSLYAVFFQLPRLPEAAISAMDYRMMREMFARMPLQKSAFGPGDIQHYVDCLSQPACCRR